MLLCKTPVATSGHPAETNTHTHTHLSIEITQLFNDATLARSAPHRMYYAETGGINMQHVRLNTFMHKYTPSRSTCVCVNMYIFQYICAAAAFSSQSDICIKRLTLAAIRLMCCCSNLIGHTHTHGTHTHTLSADIFTHKGGMLAFITGFVAFVGWCYSPCPQSCSFLFVAPPELFNSSARLQFDRNGCVIIIV